MSEWISKELCQIAKITKGQQLNKTCLFPHGDYYVLNGGIEPSGYYDKWNTEADTISISEGGNSCGYVNYNRERFWSGGHCYSLSKINEISTECLFHILKYRQPDIMALRVGSGLPNIQRKALSTFEILLPADAEEQEKISHIFSNIDTVIEKTKAIIDKYKVIRLGLMQDLLGNGIDENGVIRSPKTHEYKDSPLGKIPVEWEVKRVRNVMPLQRGFDLPSDKIKEGQYPVACSNGIVGYHNCFTTQGPCVWTGRSGTIGNVFFSLQNTWVHNTSLWVTNFNKNNPKFIYYLLTHFNLKKYAAGTGVPTLNRNDLHSEYVKIPSNVTEQSKIVERLESIDSLLEYEQKILLKLIRKKIGLMQDLLTHKVPVDPLLERSVENE